MGIIDTYRTNITAESVMLLILVFLLISCFLQIKKIRTVEALMILIVLDIMLLICQISEWSLMISSAGLHFGNGPSHYVLKKLTYTLDYSLFYFVSVAFYNYITVHINDILTKSGKKENNNKKQISILVTWGIVITCVFGILIDNSDFYYINEQGMEIFNVLGYDIMYVCGMLATVLSTFTLIKDKKVLGNLNFFLLLSYIITPYIFAFRDIRRSTAYTYVLIAFYTFVLYMHIDLRLDKEFVLNEEKIIKQDKELSELNTQIMLSQMQPHFLYNILSTISALCYVEGASKAKQVVDKFSEYFRENLDAMGKEKYISFEKELNHIETYLWLEQIRFEGALNVTYELEVLDFSVPSLSIQPIVENAVKHGIRKKKGGGTVTIKTKELENEFQVIVIDDGAGFSVGTYPNDNKSHIGIENIKNRLQILCDGTIDFESEINKGTCVTVHIPKGVRR